MTRKWCARSRLGAKPLGPLLLGFALCLLLTQVVDRFSGGGRGGHLGGVGVGGIYYGSSSWLTSSAVAVRVALDEDPIHIFHTVCAWGVEPKDYGFSGLLAMKSILMARARGASKRRRYHFHVAVDEHMRAAIGNPAEWEEMADVLDYVANRTEGRVTISWYNVEDVVAAAAAVVGAPSAGAVPLAMFQQCSTLRLFLPFIGGPLAGVDRVLYLDYDVVDLCDLELMWAEELADDWPTSAVLSFANEGPHPLFPTIYMKNPGQPDQKRLPSADIYFAGFNAGVAAVRLDRWRAVAVDYWADVVDIVATGGYAAFNESTATAGGPNGLYYADQDILNLLSARHPAWFRVLPLRYNWRYEA